MVLVANHGDEDGAHHDTAVDFHGNPADKSKTGGWLAAGLILGTELSERICVMGISMNLVTYLVGDLHISSAKSATIVTNFLGTLNLLGLLGGFLADAKLGRYLTVVIFSSITAVVSSEPKFANIVDVIVQPSFQNMIEVYFTVQEDKMSPCLGLFRLFSHLLCNLVLIVPYQRRKFFLNFDSGREIGFEQLIPQPVMVPLVEKPKIRRISTVEVFMPNPFCLHQGVTLLTLATTISSMRPPPCDNYRRQHHQCIEADGRQMALLYAALYTIALGGGGIKSNVSGFGSDQFDSTDPKEEKAMIFFFNRFYFCISIGSLFAVIVLVYVQDNVGRGWGYGTSAGTMVIAVAILLCGTPWYRFKRPQGSPLTVIWRVLFLSWRKRNHPYPSHPSLLNDYHNSKVPHTEKFKFLDKASIIDDHASAGGNKNNPWIVSTVMEVEEVKMVLKLIPIWSTCILFWTVYSQMTTFTIEQATFMNRKVGSLLIPSGSFSTFLFITILLFTSLNERLFVPLSRKLTHNTQGLTSLQRIGIGLIFSVAAMVAAAVIENARREIAVRHNSQISAFWLVPQFFLVGAGEAFVYVGQLEFFIREAPERMKSMSTGLFLSTLSMGFFVSSLLVSIVDKVTKKTWLRSNLNKGRLNNFHWLLAVLGTLNFFVFLVFSIRHQYKVRLTPGDSGEKELNTFNDLIAAETEKKVSDGKEGPPV